MSQDAWEADGRGETGDGSEGDAGDWAARSKSARIALAVAGPPAPLPESVIVPQDSDSTWTMFSSSRARASGSARWSSIGRTKARGPRTVRTAVATSRRTRPRSVALRTADSASAGRPT